MHKFKQRQNQTEPDHNKTIIVRRKEKSFSSVASIVYAVSSAQWHSGKVTSSPTVQWSNVHTVRDKGQANAVWIRPRVTNSISRQAFARHWSRNAHPRAPVLKGRTRGEKKSVTLCREASGSVAFAETSDGCNHDPRRDLNLPLHHLAASSDPSYGRQQPVPDWKAVWGLKAQKGKESSLTDQIVCEVVRRFWPGGKALVVGWEDERWFDSPSLGSPFSSKVVVYGHCLVVLPLTNNETLKKMVLFVVHLNAEAILMVTV